MRNNDLPQGLYTPLSQIVTDSDSEEEIHNSVKHSSTITNNLSKHQEKDNVIIANPNKMISSNYNSDGDDNGSLDHQTDLDNVAILQDNSRKSMSPIRKCFFVASIVVCVLTVIIFLWIIPCSDDLSCPSRIERIRTHNWVRDYENIELKGAINVVAGVRGRSKNLIFMYRGDKSQAQSAKKPKTNGIIALIGSLGQIAWYDEMINEPRNIDCSLLDADKNGVTDCLVIDEFGQLSCINPVSGQWMWVTNIYDTEKNFEKADLLDFPLILPDLNKDGVNDLLFASSLGTAKHNHLVLISGSSGLRIGSSYLVKNCSSIHKLQVDNSFNIRYNCWNDKSRVSKTISLNDLYKLITGTKLGLKKFGSPVQLPQHKFYGQAKGLEIQRTTNTVSGKQLIVENRGVCPRNCSVNVQLYELKKEKNFVRWNFTGTRMYGMVPAKISFNNSNVKSKSLVHGFVLKFWEWSKNESDFKANFTVNKRFKRETTSTGEYNIFSNVLVRQQKWELPQSNSADEITRKSRAASNSSKDGILNTKIRFIKETIILIVFNSTDTKIENTSQSNIIQFCNYNNNELVCQPDLNYQENSLLIADLDDDGNQELVSYYTTYYNSDADKTHWKLKTYVQLLRLQSELPKLYNTDTRN